MVHKTTIMLKHGVVGIASHETCIAVVSSTVSSGGTKTGFWLSSKKDSDIHSARRREWLDLAVV